MIDVRAVEAALDWISKKPKVNFARQRSATDVRRDVEDCFEMSRAAGKKIFPAKIEGHLAYCDATSNFTIRTVQICGAFAFNGVRYLDCFCELRNEYRSFRYENIVSLTARGRLLIDREQSVYKISDELGFDFDIQTLNGSDFFAHPRNWGAYRRPIAILLASRIRSFPDPIDSFQEIFGFCAESMKKSKWEGWYCDQKAAGLALLGMRIDVTNIVAAIEYESVRGGRFNFEAFNRAYQKQLTL